MPCGGICPLSYDASKPVTSKHPCWQCNKPNPDCSLEEWDSFIHSACVPAFLETEEGKIVLNHGHEVVIWNEGTICVLHEEKVFVEQWIKEHNDLEAKLREVQLSLDEHRKSCWHKLKDGTKTTRPVGGGESVCNACGTQLD